MMKNIIIAICFLVGFAGTAMALPTEKDTKVTWEMPNPPNDLAGFYLYWVSQSSVERVFSDVNRVQIADPLARSAIIVDVNPGASGGLCAQITAYDTSGNESGFGLYPLGSTEACGWFGMTAPSGLGVE